MGEIKDLPILFEKKEDCCGCGACLNICPKQAISMKEDECGFIYPRINNNLCIGCGLCKRVCAFQNSEVVNRPLDCFAAVSKNENQAKESASAGIFAAIAYSFLDNGDIVYGAAFDGKGGIHHIKIDSVKELKCLQGSKYAHSDTERCFLDVKNQLLAGKRVLYSGTPCQIAGLKAYLGEEKDDLYTVDIVCHGVPSVRMFKEYIQVLCDKYKGNVEYFTFRDKSIGWGINGSAIINGKKIKIWQSASSYLYYFTKGLIYRENCYKCKYASSNRPADITIGDFWGIEKQHPDFLREKGWNESKGISCIIVNTDKGRQLIKNPALVLKKSTFEKVSAFNTQLRKPCEYGKRDEIIECYRNSHWMGLEKLFNKNIGFRKHSSFLKSLIPYKIKRTLKRIRK